MLKLPNTEAEWLDLDLPQGRVRVRMRAITRHAVRHTRELAFKAMQSDEAPDTLELSEQMSAALMRAGLVDWEGVGDADGNPVPVTPETVEQFLLHPDAFLALDIAYCRPWYERDREKNASSGSPSGTGTAAMPGSDIASLPATLPPAAAAPPAPTAKPPRKPPTAN